MGGMRIVLLVVLAAAAQITVPADGIREAERAIARADAEAIRHLGDQIAGSDIDGRVLDRVATLGALHAGELGEDLDVRSIAPNAALAVGTRRDTTSGTATRFLHVWIKGDTSWHLSAFHETVVSVAGEGHARIVEAPLKDSILASTATGVEGEILDAERERRNVFAAQSAQRYEQLASANYVAILVNGIVHDRAARAVAVTKHSPYDTSNVVVEVYGSVAIVRAAQTDDHGPMRVTRVWVRQSERWIVAAHAGTLVARSR